MTSVQAPAKGWRAHLKSGLWLAVLLVWLVGLFRQGLFYPMAGLVAAGALALLAGAALALSGPELLAWRPRLADAGAAAVAAAYLLSMTHAILPDAAARQAALVLAGLALYAGVRSGAFGPTVRTAAAIRLTVVVGALLVTLAGLLGAVGLVHLAEPTLDGMLISTFQYHNSYAALALVGLILALSGLGASRRPLSAALGAAGASWLALGVVLSQSRGAWLVAPVVLLVWLVGLPRLSRGRALLLFGATVVGTALATPWALAALSLDSAHRLLAALALAAFASAALAAAVDRLWQGNPRLGRRLAAAVMAAGAGLGVLAALVLRSRITRLIPHVLASRAASLSLSDASVTTRIEMFRIAFALIRQAPLTGYGGGAWLDLYHNLSPVFFVANETHSFVTQVLIEAGPLGGAALALLAAGVIVAAFAVRRVPGAAAPEGWGLAVALLALAGHGAFDFDLSFFDLAILAWLLAAALAGLASLAPSADPAAETTEAADAAPRPPPRPRRVRGAIGACALAVAVVATVGCADLAIARLRLGGAQTALAAGRVARARDGARATLALDPWSAAAYLVEAAAAASAPARAALLIRAASLEPDAPDPWSAYTEALLASGRVAHALAASQRALSAGPWDVLAATAAALADDAALGRAGALAQQGAFDLAELEAEITGEGGNLEVPVGSGLAPAAAQAALEAALGRGEVLSGAPAAGAQSLAAAASADARLEPSLAPWLMRAARALRSGALEAEAQTWSRAP